MTVIVRSIYMMHALARRSGEQQQSSGSYAKGSNQLADRCQPTALAAMASRLGERTRYSDGYV